jgi:hypothetical protein
MIDGLGSPSYIRERRTGKSVVQLTKYSLPRRHPLHSPETIHENSIVGELD